MVFNYIYQLMSYIANKLLQFMSYIANELLQRMYMHQGMQHMTCIIACHVWLQLAGSLKL